MSRASLSCTYLSYLIPSKVDWKLHLYERSVKKKRDCEAETRLGIQVAYPKDKVQHKDHILHARTDVCEVVASPAIVHHRVVAETLRMFHKRLSIFESARQLVFRTRSFSNYDGETQLASAMQHNLTATTRSTITVPSLDVPLFNELGKGTRRKCPEIFRVYNKCGKL